MWKAILLVCAAAPLVNGQGSLRFEVASLKASEASGRGGIRPAPGGERYLANNMPLMMMISVAYQLKVEQVVGGPSWVATTGWDMNAKAEKPSTAEELHVMLQNLLADRFQLRFHKEKKELPIYALTVDKGGVKMTPHDGGNAGDPWIDVAVDRVVKMKWKATFAPMDFLAWRLGLALDRPVVNLTGLKGGYDFDLAYTRDLPPGFNENTLLNGATIDTSGPTIFQALQKQLGLKLEAQKGPVEVIVIDHVEKPTAN